MKSGIAAKMPISSLGLRGGGEEGVEEEEGDDGDNKDEDDGDDGGEGIGEVVVVGGSWR